MQLHWILSGLLVSAVVATTAEAADAALTPSDVVRAALENDPSLVASQADADAAIGARREGVFRLPNPEVSADLATNGEQRVGGSLVQPVSISGESIFASRSASANADAAQAGAKRAMYVTAANARRAYARAVLEREKLRFAEEDRTLLSRLRSIAERRVAAGEGIDLDLRLARLEEARAAAAWLDAQAEASAADIDLASLIGAVPGELLPDPLVAISAEPGDSSPRSDVAAAQAATRAARAALSRERAARLPTIGIGGFYERDDGRVTAGPTVTIPLPLWRQNQAGVAAAAGSLRLAQAQEASTSARVATEEARAAERLRVAEESLAVLAPDLRSEADPALRGVERLFMSGKMNLADTLLLRSRVVEGQRAWMEARAAVAVARIDVALARQSSVLLP